MNQKSFLKFWSLAVGSMDALTGFLLIINPMLVLWLLGIEQPSSDALIFLSWIGTFVMAVGLSYAFAILCPSEGEMVWAITTLVRLLVVMFLGYQIFVHAMSPKWGLVAFADGFVAVVQWIILRAGWWKGIEK